MNLDYVEQTVTGSNDVQQAVQSIVTRCDAIYIPTDNTFASAMPLVGSVVIESGTPVICGAKGMVEARRSDHSGAQLLQPWLPDR